MVLSLLLVVLIFVRVRVRVLGTVVSCSCIYYLCPINRSKRSRHPFFRSKGSVIVDFTIFFRGDVNPNTATGPLKRAIESGKLGTLTVDKTSFSVDSTTATPPKSTPTDVSTGV